ncbi:MAG: Smr/MutS family protein [Treponema sp.]|jgi:DNA mismatch repair protein MutS2|nr:Smr/MutS family protein [Treponema sp.]
MSLNEKTINLLEFHRIRQSAAERALCAGAARRILNETPSGDPAAVAEAKERVAAICDLVKTEDGENLELPEIGFLLPKLEVEGAVLDVDEAFALGLFTERGGAFLGWLARSEKLRELASSVPDLSALRGEIFKLIDRDGKLRDLPELKKIRRRIQDLSRELESLAAKYSSGEETRRMLQSPLPSQRDGRLVLAVKANFRGRIRGIVHEVSSTGQTIFVEPEESVEKNNRLLIERGNLDAEIRRLLRELTGRIAGRREELAEFYRRIIYLETLRAKARYSLDTGGCFALDAPGEAGLRLVRARHPLLGPGAVPVDFSLDEKTRMAIITGPNTGGKTVALKTIGLFALMNQAALAVPAGEGTSLPLFDNVFADIGDEQSISQSLSTFSAHMLNIASIVSAATKDSLVLLDELGSGTDPEEGSAIAMAILDHFIEKKNIVVVTTHHGVLKNYGYSREGVENASVEFDGKTLSPTYRIVMGLPGESRALDIAARNGLDPDTLNRARSYLDEERSDVSALIAGLKEKHRELDTVSRKAGEEQKRLREERRRADLKDLSLRQKEHYLRFQGAGEFRRLLSESRKKLENLVRELREGEISREKTVKVKEFLRGLERDSAAIDAALEAEEAALKAAADGIDSDDGNGADGKNADGKGAAGGIDSPAAAVIVPGSEVLLKEGRRRGRALRKDNRGGDPFWVVEIGSVKMSLPESALVPAAPLADQKPLIGPADLAFPAEPRLELSVRGMRLDEALDALRRQIDAAVLAGMKEFSVVHGKGDGILQKGVQDYLKQERAVADYYFSRPELGGFGRTEVVLRG